MSLSGWSGVLDYTDMPIEHIVVDGSNIATEGRSLPSLKQLEEAVAELKRDHPNAEITVIVDATFAHRIDPSELARFEQAALRGEYVHPPAGAIGRGDAFLLRVAERVDATVLSNDSFQEFHGEHPWLFERGRLLGGTPVPGIGWIFSPRQPVRGPRSRQAVRETVQAKKRVTKAIAVATKEVVEPGGPSLAIAGSVGRSRGRRSTGEQALERPPEGSRNGGKPTPLAVNDPLAFISFIAEHPLGEQVEGEVEGYTSHGAVVRVGEMRCYVPLANMGDPPPRSAREVLKRRERMMFVLTALDPQRRGAELALPGIACVSGHPREETVAAEVRLAQSPRKRGDALGTRAVEPGKKVATAPRSTKKAATATKAPLSAKETAAKASTARTSTKKTTTVAETVAKAAAPTAVTKRATARKLSTPKLVAVPSPQPGPATTKKAAAATRAPAKKTAVSAKKTAAPAKAARVVAAQSGAEPPFTAGRSQAPTTSGTQTAPRARKTSGQGSSAFFDRARAPGCDGAGPGR